MTACQPSQAASVGDVSSRPEVFAVWLRVSYTHTALFYYLACIIGVQFVVCFVCVVGNFGKPVICQKFFNSCTRGHWLTGLALEFKQGQGFSPYFPQTMASRFHFKQLLEKPLFAGKPSAAALGGTGRWLNGLALEFKQGQGFSPHFPQTMASRFHFKQLLEKPLFAGKPSAAALGGTGRWLNGLALEFKQGQGFSPHFPQTMGLKIS